MILGIEPLQLKSSVIYYFNRLSLKIRFNKSNWWHFAR